jgi:uncharacterized protein
MKYQLIHDGDLKSWAVVLDPGDEVIASLCRFAREARLTASQISAIGAFSDATIGFFVLEKKDYNKIHINEQVEVLSLLGDVALQGADPKLHLHVVLGKHDGTAHGGHLLKAHVQPTLEVIVTEAPKHLVRTFDSATGLALINLSR